MVVCGGGCFFHPPPVFRIRAIVTDRPWLSSYQRFFAYYLLYVHFKSLRSHTKQFKFRNFLAYFEGSGSGVGSRSGSVQLITDPVGPKTFFLRGIFIFLIFMYVIQHCVICRPSDSSVSVNAGIDPKTVATSALTARRSKPSVDKIWPKNLPLSTATFLDSQ
jgi:hypothetical protein